MIIGEDRLHGYAIYAETIEDWWKQQGAHTYCHLGAWTRATDEPMSFRVVGISAGYGH